MVTKGKYDPVLAVSPVEGNQAFLQLYILIVKA